jgi:hypothetical protein
MQLTIEKLRKAGFKVRVMHSRAYTQVMSPKMSRMCSDTVLSSKGGYTKIEITTPDNAITVAADATCSHKDSFNRKLGNSIALGRAVSKLIEFEHVKSFLEKI